MTNILKKVTFYVEQPPYFNMFLSKNTQIMSTKRILVMQEVGKRIPVKFNNNNQQVSKYYGANVFGLDAMREFLSERINGCANANTKLDIAKILKSKIIHSFNFDLLSLSCFSSFKNWTLVK